MRADKLFFVAIRPKNGGFEASLSLEAFMIMSGDPESVLQTAAELYSCAVLNMRRIIDEIGDYRAKRKPVPARLIWRLGDQIFRLRDQLQVLSLQLDDMYAHLVRDLGVKRKWLEKVIILRRHLPDEELIPESLNWGRCEKGTRRVAEKLRTGASV